MNTFTSTKAAATPRERQIAEPGHAAQLRNEARDATVDTRPGAATLQRLRTLANNSHQALQLRQQAERVATSPHAMTLQRLQQTANNSPRARQFRQQAERVAGAASAHQRAMPVQGSGIVQRIVDVGGTIYKANDRTGHTPDDLVRDVRLRAAKLSVPLKKAKWPDNLRSLARDKVATTTYASLDEIIDAVKSEAQDVKRKRLIDEQDQKITALLANVTDPTKLRARRIAYESRKAMASVRKHIGATDEFTKTKAELEALKPAEIGAKNEVEATENSAFVFEALVQSDKMKRLDFNFHDTPIVTHGYESMGDRTKDASTLKPFGLGPIKIGDDIGSYRQALKRKKDIRGPSNKVLTNLEMMRIPQTSAMVGLKRDLYEQKKIPLEEAIAADSPKSNVEFLGAVKGSGLTVDQKDRMQLQQIFSNAHTLDDYAAKHPKFEIGTQTKDKKARTTPSAIKDALDEFEKTKDKPRKKAFRKELKRAIASTMEIDNFDSGSDVSDYDETHYK